MTVRVCLIAQFAVEHATGNDLKDTLESLGVDVWPLQEQDRFAWNALNAALEAGNGPDAVIWNRTPTLSAAIPLETRRLMLETAERVGVPTIAYHLDRWWGLQREHEVFKDPYFRCQYVFTADGHDPERWKSAEVNHFWAPPAIAARNCAKGQPTHRFQADIVFIGTWWGYHKEWGHRTEMIMWLKRYFGKQFLALPLARHPQLRGQAFSDQIAAAKIVVGDSCLVPDGDRAWTRYCSDRVFEVPGRGGFLIHPAVYGICAPRCAENLLEPGQHLATWELDDWDGMRRTVAHYLESDGERRQIADQGLAHIRALHTYTARLRHVFDVVGIEV